MAKGKRAGAPAGPVQEPKKDEQVIKLKSFAELGVKAQAAVDKEIEKAEHDTAPASEDQGWLFGGADKVRSALSSELAIINGEIDQADERMIGLKAKIQKLEDRRRVLEDAMRSLGVVLYERLAGVLPFAGEVDEEGPKDGLTTMRGRGSSTSSPQR